MAKDPSQATHESLDKEISLDPVMTQRTTGPSPVEEKAITDQAKLRARASLANAEASGPTIRQRTQSEILDLSLLKGQLGNPFSIRWIPFEQLREMTTDLMLAFGWWMTVTQVVRAEWSIQCPDAQLAAAVDAALRPIYVESVMNFSNDLWYGHQPGVKRFYLGQLGATYRDPNGTDPSKDLPVWTSSADMLLWRPPISLNPAHCLPQWDEDGQMVGFKFSQTPIPHYDLISASSAYGYMVIPGHFIGPDFALWTVNEAEQNFGNIFGSPRTKRAYPYWWSYWFRWRLADRSYENLADPAKLVYYPTDFDQYVDQDDTDQENPMVRRARDTAIATGEQTRSGATVALPGSVMESQDGHMSTLRKWEIDYLKAPNNFADLNATFQALDTMKLRSWFIPENAFIEGQGSRTAGGSAGGTGGARMASQLGQIYEESNTALVERYDEVFNEHFIPQFIAANFPEKMNIPCRKESRALGVLDDQTRSQILQLIGQVRGEVIPVDVRALLEQMNVPLLNEDQFKAEVKNISELAALMGPPQQEPQKVGTQGYNSGVAQSNVPGKPNFYYQPKEIINLAESDGFMKSLPDTPHYQDAGVRSAVVRLRRLMVDRYSAQYGSFVDFLRKQPTLHLSENQPEKKQTGLDKKQAAAAATAILALWAQAHAPGSVADDGELAAKIANLSTLIGLRGGKGALKSARLHVDDFSEDTLAPWASDRAKFAIDSVDQTVRSEVADWLIDELQKTVDPATVANAAEEHFRDFAVGHANRVTRTEAVVGFNHGTLEALHHAGVVQVQAHDASDGTDTQTDAECQQRNGEVFSVQDAMGVEMHPNDTLYWRPLTTEKLSLERVDKLPEHLLEDGRHVAYDENSETLYVDSALDDLQTKAMLIILGDQLAY